MALCGVRSDRVGECLAAAGVAAVDDRRRDVRKRRADGGDLRLGLVPAADHAEADGALLREMLRRHAARCAGAQPAELIGLDHREHVVPLRMEQHEHELRAARAGGVRLHAGDAEAEVGGRHHGQPAFLEPQPVARAVLDLARCLPAERSLDRLEGVADREDRLDVLLGQVQRHGRKPIAARSCQGEEGPCGPSQAMVVDSCRGEQLRHEPRHADRGHAAPRTEVSPHRPEQPAEAAHVLPSVRTVSRCRVRVRQRCAHEPLLVSQLGDLVLCRGVRAHRVGG